MKKDKEFDRLGHTLLMQSSTNLIEVIKIKADIDANEELSGKEKKELYSDMIEASLRTQRTVASIMSAAGKSSTFRFSKKDAMKLSAKDIADRLGVKVECDETTKDSMQEKLEKVGKELAKKMGVKASSVHAIEMPPEAAAAMGAMLEAISKKNGDK